MKTFITVSAVVAVALAAPTPQAGGGNVCTEASRCESESMTDELCADDQEP